MIAILSRAPVPGACKTRLIPHLGRRGAARVQRRLLARAVQTALASAHPVDLWVEPEVRYAAALDWRRQTGLPLHRQPRGDLGRRMVRVLNRILCDNGSAVLIGSDALDLTADDLTAAFRVLCDNDFVMQPSTDGGYVLIGSRRRLPSAALAGIEWSSGREAGQTRGRLRRIGSLAELPARRDLDDAADWRAARRAGLIRPL